MSKCHNRVWNVTVRRENWLGDTNVTTASLPILRPPRIPIGVSREPPTETLSRNEHIGNQTPPIGEQVEIERWRIYAEREQVSQNWYEGMEHSSPT